MTDKQYKLFKRYLKERGIYSIFFREASRFPERRLGETINSSMVKCFCTEPIMNLITWRKTNLGHSFWSKEHLSFTKFVRNIGLKRIDYISKDSAYEHFEKIKKVNFEEQL